MTKQEEIREGIAKIVKICANKPDVYTPEMCAIDLAEYLHSERCRLEVDRELPNTFDYKMVRIELPGYLEEFLKESGYVAVEPIIEEE